MTTDSKYQAAERFADWLAMRVHKDASGADVTYLETRPQGRFWLGRLAPEIEIRSHDLGDRAERLEPCAVGLRILPNKKTEPISISGRASFAVWRREPSKDWVKFGPIEVEFEAELDLDSSAEVRLEEPFKQALEAAELGGGLSAAISLQSGRLRDGRRDLTVTLVNTSDPDDPKADDYAKARMFECTLEVEDPGTEDFLLESLPDSFRYDRRVPAWGINAGVERNPSGFKTSDMPRADRKRPRFWNIDNQTPPDLRFETLSTDPLPSLEALVGAHAAWGAVAWDEEIVLGDETNDERRTEFKKEKALFDLEAERLQEGLKALHSDAQLAKAFRFMNEAMILSARGRYDGWRPFQIGFLLANIKSCRGEEADLVDIVWFATGGGKTETYLGLILTAALFDRMRGKTTGVTAWSRFPLRLQSLQQTQRFANALAAAEIVRRRRDLGGDPFGLGFLVGDGSTPNKIPSDGKSGPWDPSNSGLANKLRMLKACPFCRDEGLKMKFNRRYWRVEHKCTNNDCDWGTNAPLPIHVVDTEIWRNLPTVIVGTLDKAAGIAMQANMKGMIGAPRGVCSEPQHGHTYAPRYGRRNGCLVPDCEAAIEELPQSPELYGLTYRLQDELHLLRDSLGAVDAHYEALLDHLQEALSGHAPKILASSATLSGYERQSDVLYNRAARVFPHPEPQVGQGFWSGDTEQDMRRFLAVAPRGQTIEYALDRMVVSLQSAIRLAINEPERVTEEANVEATYLPFLVGLYGTNVVYGNTLRDLDAVVRSAATQWGDIPAPRPQVTSLTGRTVFEEVANTLERLEAPEADFSNRIHVVAASSMMSHGVDVDRLNVMVMLGLPLTTAEFIQATARVGRRWPALAFIVHKIGRERDASIYRAFPKYVSQGDRFVEPIPITGRSRRVLERTIPGLAFARILMLHEHLADRTVWKAYGLKEYIQKVPDFKIDEAKKVCELLGYDDAASEALKAEVEAWYERWLQRIDDPANSNKWSTELGLPALGPMRSLRDVAEQVEVRGKDPS